MSEGANKKLLGFWDLMSISLGQIIGTGVVVLTGISISMTGYGAPWAFIFALAIVAIPTICIAALGSAVPSTGGNYTYVRDLLGSKTSFFYLSLLIAGQVILASYAIGFAEYADAIIPGLNMKFIAAFIMILGYAVIAVPTGIISAEMVNSTKEEHFEISTQACRYCGHDGHDYDAVHCKFCGEKLNEGNRD